MASITVRNLDERLKRRLRLRAAGNGRSMEQEVREILREVLDREEAPDRGLASTIRARFESIGGVDLELPSREPMREPPQFD